MLKLIIKKNIKQKNKKNKEIKNFFYLIKIDYMKKWTMIQ